MAWSKERRTHPRRRTDWQILIGESRCGGLRSRGWTVDAGAGGLRLVCDEAVRPDEEVRLLVLAGGKFMRLEGKISRCVCLGDGEFELGVELSGSGSRYRNILEGGSGAAE